MSKLTFNGQTYECRPEETVLEALLRNDVDVPHGCRQGVCQSCMVQCLEGAPPAISQKDLSDTARSSNHFLACLCQPREDMVIALPGQHRAYTTAHVVEKAALNRHIVRIVLQTAEPLSYRAGQFVRLRRSDGLVRSYSIASPTAGNEMLELHIRRLVGGRFSAWIWEELEAGDTIEVSGPAGQCFYVPGRRDQGMLLIGTGSGLAPLVGILSDALDGGHAGPICLFHGSRDAADLYLIEEMRGLTERYANLSYTPCVSGDEVPEGFASGRAHDVALSTLRDLKGWRVYLCGHPDMVATSRKKAYLQGASLKEIYADAFFSEKTTALSGENPAKQ